MEIDSYILLKDMPGCPKGRIFKRNVIGQHFTSIMDEEFLDIDCIQGYTIDSRFVENNTEWFKPNGQHQRIKHGD